jgi:hypothetical protein
MKVDSSSEELVVFTKVWTRGIEASFCERGLEATKMNALEAGPGQLIRESMHRRHVGSVKSH